ncbi:hypothetical protein [Lentibacillus sp. JNUCC-1]|uniref:hypothetical protein n=1 Tax=Lentibacillus sp. JNUCC-1 TaxID=2654513 RepID=UPI0012E8FD32|nr:hypothetical protein [Lentibacillus sp. JNUCC-1]
MKKAAELEGNFSCLIECLFAVIEMVFPLIDRPVAWIEISLALIEHNLACIEAYFAPIDHDQAWIEADLPSIELARRDANLTSALYSAVPVL